MPAHPGTARLIFLLHNKLITNILINHSQKKISIPSEVEVNPARNINISQ